MAMPTGATSATLTMAPGPSVAMSPAMRNSRSGTSRLRPCASPRSRPASSATLPLTSASVNNSVTPARVMKSAPGNAARTAGDCPAYAATAQASGIASSPTLTRDVQLRTMAAIRAQTEASEGLMRARGAVAHGVQQHVDAERVAVDREGVEVARVIRFALPRVADVGVVGCQQDDAAAAIERGAGVRLDAVGEPLGCPAGSGPVID